ncbi:MULTISPECIES: hypothetical protein [Paraburkholderia]|uniref:hypothetical protein n=1 Tax=Paraburkholderia TaxID=1822464 RepID=UPI003218C16D
MELNNLNNSDNENNNGNEKHKVQSENLSDKKYESVATVRETLRDGFKKAK